MRPLLFFFIYIVILSDFAKAELRYIQKGYGSNLIIFVHGFRGDPVKSFRSMRKSWPGMIASDMRTMRAGPPLGRYGVATISYPAGLSDRLRLEDIAEHVRLDLVDNSVFDDYQNIHIIAHSMGGLVVKRMYTKIHNENPLLTKKIKSIFLISVPSQGAPAANFLGKLSSAIPTPLLKDIETVEGNSFLLLLKNTWENLIRQRKTDFPRIYCAYERKPTLGIKVVPQVYTATICDNTPLAENEDHISIAKPTSIKSRMYTWVRGRIAETYQKIRANEKYSRKKISYLKGKAKHLQAIENKAINAESNKTNNLNNIAFLTEWLKENPNIYVSFRLPDWLEQDINEYGRYFLKDPKRSKGLLLLRDETSGGLHFKHDHAQKKADAKIWQVRVRERKRRAGYVKVTSKGLHFSSRLWFSRGETQCLFRFQLIDKKMLDGKAYCSQAGNGYGFVPFPVNISLE